MIPTELLQLKRCSVSGTPLTADLVTCWRQMTTHMWRSRVKFLERALNEPFIAGQVNSAHIPHWRTTKWIVDREQYPEPEYLPYISGNLYIASGKLLTCMASTARPMHVHGPSKLRRYVYDWSGGHGIVSSPGRHWRRMGSQTFINAVLRVRASCVIEHDANSQSAFRIYRRFLGISWCSYVLKLFLPRFNSCWHREKMFNAVSFTGTGIRLPYSTALIKSRRYHGIS